MSTSGDVTFPPRTGPATTKAPAVPKIALKNVTRTFGNFTAVDGVSLDITDGEFVVLLGPSGCGKSTLLRMIAGLQAVSSGEIEIEGEQAQDSEPAERDLAFVFQNYALYPHMTVRRNMSFPLIMRRHRWWHHLPGLGWWSRRQIERKPEVVERIEQIAGILGLEEMLHRTPATLSGGQRQRVALGRAMVREPLAFLMDEPLSNLDAKLRAQTRSELIRFHQLLETTIVYVTHDQVEAMTMGDKIGVMLDGHLQQFGTPREVYENPANTFVAQFIGTPAMNLLPARHTEVGWEISGQILQPSEALDEITRRATTEDDGFLLGVRSEWVSLEEPHVPSTLRGTVVTVEDWGAEQLVRVELSSRGATTEPALKTHGNALDVRVPSQQRVQVGDSVGLTVATAQTRAFDSRTGQSLTEGGPGARSDDTTF
ncbi:ABC transporter ATP-binding protein [Aeromicrobium sp. CTD01-1L150]|uniref:ABC transporter ATP-binding protein n=1 Tax=Aeromicrobium sp. CTD01-1L150 TaxID=3341830 RepID=UPI0035C07372